MPSKRQAIIEAAARLFYAHGYHAIGIDRIIAEAGVAKMTMYKHFASKSELIGAVLAERDMRFRESLFSFAKAFDGPLEKLNAIFTWHDRWLNDHAFNGCMFISAAAEYPEPGDEIHVISKRHKQAIQDYVTETLRAIAEEKVARRLGVQLLQVLDGALVMGLIFRDRNAAITAWRTATAVLRAEGLIDS